MSIARLGSDFAVATNPVLSGEPKISALADGRAVILYRFDAGVAGFSLAAVVADPDGTFQSHGLVPTTTVRPLDWAIATLPDHHVVATWSNFQGASSDIRARLLDEHADGIGNDFPVQSTFGTPNITALAGGGFVVAWVTGTSPFPIDARMFAPDGATVGAPINVGTLGGHPSLAGLTEGGWVAVWGSGQTTAARARIFNADGSPSGGLITVVPEDSGINAQQTAVTALQGGGFAVTYGNFTIYGNTDIYGRIFDAGGQAVGGEFLVNPFSNLSADVSAPAMTTLADGRFLVTWASNRGGEQGAIWAGLFAPDGSPADTPFIVNTTTQGSKSSPSVTALPDGGVAFAWDSREPSTFFERVAFFDPTKMIGSAHADILKGGNFDDQFYGNGGADTMAGGMGDDQYFVYDPAAVVVEAIGQGELDRVFSHVSYALPAGAEIEKVSTDDHAGTASIDLVGNGLFNAIYGNEGDNHLDGKAGDDSLSGWGGNDRIDGGGGEDRAFFRGARAEYDVRTFSANGELTTVVAHQSGAPNDGVDTLTGVEAMRFSDRAFALAGAQLNHHSSVDGDRFDDVLFQNASTGQVLFARMVDGAFQSWGSVTDPLGTDWKAVASGDVNPGPTGGAETFVQQQSTGSIYYASLDTGTVTWGVVTTDLTSDWKLRTVADLNGDAAVDAIVQNQTTGTIHYAATANGAFQGWHVVRADLGTDWLAVGAGDINRDGFADVVVQRPSTGAIYYADMANGVFSGWGIVSQNLTPDWKVKAVADVSGDGFADVIVQQQASTGTTYFADMRNGAFDHWGVVTANVSAAWVVQGTADVDNDGFNDVLFQNSQTGTTYYANMGPSGFEGWGAVASNITPEWQVV